MDNSILRYKVCDSQVIHGIFLKNLTIENYLNHPCEVEFIDLQRNDQLIKTFDDDLITLNVYKSKKFLKKDFIYVGQHVVNGKQTAKIYSIGNVLVITCNMSSNCKHNIFESVVINKNICIFLRCCTSCSTQPNLKCIQLLYHKSHLYNLFPFINKKHKYRLYSTGQLFSNKMKSYLESLDSDELYEYYIINEEMFFTCNDKLSNNIRDDIVVSINECTYTPKVLRLSMQKDDTMYTALVSPLSNVLKEIYVTSLVDEDKEKKESIYEVNGIKYNIHKNVAIPNDDIVFTVLGI